MYYCSLKMIWNFFINMVFLSRTDFACKELLNANCYNRYFSFHLNIRNNFYSYIIKYIETFSIIFYHFYAFLVDFEHLFFSLLKYCYFLWSILLLLILTFLPVLAFLNYCNQNRLLQNFHHQIYPILVYFAINLSILGSP